MRIALTIDDDLADALEERAKGLGVSFDEVVNEALRRGLAAQEVEHRPVSRVRPFRSGFRPGIDPLKLNQLNDELEVQAFLEKHARGSSRT